MAAWKFRIRRDGHDILTVSAAKTKAVCLDRVVPRIVFEHLREILPGFYALKVSALLCCEVEERAELDYAEWEESYMVIVLSVVGFVVV
jgi:hypothetical protein